MVSSISAEPVESSGNPLDLVEHIAIANEWPFHRQNEEELATEIAGHWCQYRLWFSWHPELGVLHLSCALEMRVQPNKRDAIYALLAQANEKLWLGHFDLCSEENLPMFRHAVLMRDGVGINLELLEDLVDIAVTECERFYPAFQFVIWGGKAPGEALAAAMLETEGEA
ncbi:MAG TPA: YbjN domain-containing protein [Geminicoccaceae bacterium]